MAFWGEELAYDIHYSALPRIARVTLRFQKGGKEGHYLATMIAEARGLMAWILKYRKYTFTSYMRSMDGGKRLLTYRFDREVRKGGHLYHTIYQIDHIAKRLRYHIVKDGILLRKGIRVIPEGINLDDILSAFYNFRYGVYGTLRKHAYYRIRTFSENGFPFLSLNILDGSEEKMERQLLGNPKGGYIARIIVPPTEIIPSKKGKVSIWTNERALPLKGVLKDAFFFGDLVGEIVKGN